MHPDRGPLGEAPAPSAPPVWRRPGVVLGVVALVAFVIPFVEGRWLFPLGSINHDEPMYTFGARLLRAGHLTLPKSFVPFRPWASGVRDGHLVLKYTPVWPGVLAVGELFGSMRLGVAAAGATAVVLTGLLGRELFGRWAEGLIASVLLVLSPLFLVQEGTYLSYLFQLTLDLAIVLLVLGALRRWPARGPAPRRVVIRLVAGGALWGIAVFARAYDALLLAVPLVLAAVVIGRRTPRRLAAWFGWSAVGAAVPLTAFLAYGWSLMGSPLRSTFSITSKYDTLLFGRRGVVPSSVFTFTRGNAVDSFVGNLGALPSWIFGGVILVALALLGLWESRRRGAQVWAVAGIAVSFAVGYALFWSPYSIVKLWPGTETMGPFYHLALLIPLTLFGAAGLAWVFDRNRIAAALIAAIMLAVTGVGLRAKVDLNRRVTREYRAAERVIERGGLGRAVLFMDDRGANGFRSVAPFLENDPDLRGSVVYATESGPDDLRVIGTHADRAPFRLRSEIRAGDELLRPTLFVERLRVRRGTEVELRFRIVNTVGAPIVKTRFRADGVIRSVVLDRASTKGETYTFAWTVTADPELPGAPKTTVALPDASGRFEVEADFDAPDQATDRYQLRYPYTVAAGRVSVLTPGWGRYLFRYRNVVWLNQDVAPTLQEVPARSSY